MQLENYKESLYDAVRVLHNAEQEVFTAMVNIGFAGEYSEISKLHEPGEILDLELAMFEDTGDANLDKMVDLVKAMAGVKESLINLNALDIDLEEV